MSGGCDGLQNVLQNVGTGGGGGRSCVTLPVTTGQRNAQAHRTNKGAQMRSAYNFSLVGPGCLDPPHLRVHGGIQVFGGYRDLPPVEECGPGPWSRGRHSLLMQHSTQRSAAHQSRQRRTTEQSCTTHNRVAQNIATPRHTKLAEAHRGAHNHRCQQTRHAYMAPPKAHNSTPQRQHRTHHTRQPRPHKHTQHKRGASLMHPREPTPSRPQREVDAAQT